VPVVAQSATASASIASGWPTQPACRRITRLEAVIHEKAGGPFTIGSPKQLGDVLFDKLGYKGGKKGKSGQYSTDQSVLETLAARARKWPRWCWNGASCPSSKAPTPMRCRPRSIPIPAASTPATACGRADRAAFVQRSQPAEHSDPHRDRARDSRGLVAEPGHVLLSADYSQIELRLAALSPTLRPLREAFEQGEDIHARTARAVRRGEPRHSRPCQDDQLRHPLWHQPLGPGHAAGHHTDEAQAMIDRYFERFPASSAIFRNAGKRARQQFFRNAVWPQDLVPAHQFRHPGRAPGSERAAINAPIQGPAPISSARHGPHAPLEKPGCRAMKMLLQVHDELVFELPEEDVAAASEVIRAVMAGAAAPSVQLTVPLGVEIGTGGLGRGALNAQHALPASRRREGANFSPSGREGDHPALPLPLAGGVEGMWHQQLPPVGGTPPAPL
jgi:DNA polymerase-1